MRRALTLMLALLALAGCAPMMMDSSTTTRIGFSMDIRSAPPPPHVVWAREPDLVVVPGSSVYVVEDVPYDVFFYSGTYYLCNEGYWYRSRSTEGPFVVVDVRSVPGPIMSVPERNWKHPHGGPPGQMRKGRGERS